jgi:N-acetylglutamate synthase-like GNAT family acetyltransferase
LAVNVGIRAAEAEEKDELERMLRAAKLPFAGVAEGFPDCYVIARSSEGVVGAAGLQTYGAAGLLRSVVVLDRIFLLTTSAEAYFKALGFEPAAREEAPANMQASAEFAGACPASAACLARRP